MSARFTDVYILGAQTPILGVGGKRLAPFRDCLEFAIKRCPELEKALDDEMTDLSTFVDNCLKLAELSSEGKALLPDLQQRGSIIAYTMKELHKTLNFLLREAERTLVLPFFPYLRLFHEALHNLRVESKTVYRGVKLDLAHDYPKDKKFTWWEVVSTTGSIDVMNTFLGNHGPRTQFFIQTSSARHIKAFSVFPDEDEYILPCGCTFKVLSVFDAGHGLTQIQVEEVGASAMLTEIFGDMKTAHSADKAAADKAAADKAAADKAAADKAAAAEADKQRQREQERQRATQANLHFHSIWVTSVNSRAEEGLRRYLNQLSPSWEAIVHIQKNGVWQPETRGKPDALPLHYRNELWKWGTDVHNVSIEVANEREVIFVYHTRYPPHINPNVYRLKGHMKFNTPGIAESFEVWIFG